VPRSLVVLDPALSRIPLLSLALVMRASVRRSNPGRLAPALRARERRGRDAAATLANGFAAVANECRWRQTGQGQVVKESA
jgi:hypothetical protein